MNPESSKFRGINPEKPELQGSQGRAISRMNPSFFTRPAGYKQLIRKRFARWPGLPASAAQAVKLSRLASPGRSQHGHLAGHWIATGQFLGKFKRKSATKNLEIKGGGT